jgi:hypothetical protein
VVRVSVNEACGPRYRRVRMMHVLRAV